VPHGEFDDLSVGFPVSLPSHTTFSLTRSSNSRGAKEAEMTASAERRRKKPLRVISSGVSGPRAYYVDLA
jgi:hypothetical protein